MEKLTKLHSGAWLSEMLAKVSPSASVLNMDRRSLPNPKSREAGASSGPGLKGNLIGNCTQKLKYLSLKERSLESGIRETLNTHKSLIMKIQHC